MSEIKKLIERLCPDGVEYKKLGEVLDYEQPSKYIVSSKDYLDEGIPVLTAGQTFILGYTDEDTGIYRASKEKPVIIFDDFTTSFHWVTFDFKVKSSAMKMLRPINNDINFRFIYYAMKCIKYETADHARQWISKYSLFEIPVPPIEVQSKIVEILDNFTELEAELEIKLEAELEARRKQYEYYRNQLLTFDKDKGTRFDVKWMKLGEVCEVTDYVANGSFASLRENVQYKNEPDFALLVRTVDLSQNFNGDKVYINEHAYNFLSKSSLHGGEIIINNIGAGVGQTFRCPYRNEPMSLGPNSIIVKTPNNDFYYHWFNSFYGQKAMSEIITPGALPKFNKTGFKSILIPIPPLEDQSRIVSILDRFEALTTDLQSGLPAEIEARRKQYEYYREQLLTFKRKTA